MTELKTLKEIEERDELIDNDRWLCESDLKAEAVKWVKVYLSFDKRRYWDSLTPFISFFNLTEKDLEGGK